MAQPVPEQAELDVLGSFSTWEDHDEEATPPAVPRSRNYKRFRWAFILCGIVAVLCALLLVGLAIVQVIASGGQTLAESATSRPDGAEAQIQGISLPFMPTLIVFGLSLIGLFLSGWGLGLGRRIRTSY